MDRDQTSWIVRTAAAIAVVVLLSATLATRGLAAEWRGHGEGGWHEHEIPHWGHGDIGRFHEKETSTGGAVATGFMATISGSLAGGGSSTGHGTSTRPRSIPTLTLMSPQQS